MKTFTTLTAVAALVAGMSVANAQNAGNTMKQDPAPNNINSGVQDGTGKAKSGTETKGTAMQKSTSDKSGGKPANTTGAKTSGEPAPNNINAGTPTGGTPGAQSGTQNKK